jgi:hypothetical protein
VRDLKEVILFDKIVAGITVVVMHDWSAEEGDVVKSYEGDRGLGGNGRDTCFFRFLSLCISL